MSVEGADADIGGGTYSARPDGTMRITFWSFASQGLVERLLAARAATEVVGHA